MSAIRTAAKPSKQRRWQIRQKAKGLCRYCPTPAYTADRCRGHAGHMSRRRTDAPEFNVAEDAAMQRYECVTCERSLPVSHYGYSNGYRRLECKECRSAKLLKRAHGGVVVNLREAPELARVHERTTKRLALAKKERGQWTRSLTDGGWVCEVSQAAYGHPARKLTWLYYFGVAAPTDLDWSRPEPTAQVSYCANHGDSPLPRLSKKAASATPPRFRDALLRLAAGSQPLAFWGAQASEANS